MKLLALVKIRSFSRDEDELWLNEWRHPLRREIEVKNSKDLLSYLESPFANEGSANE